MESFVSKDCSLYDPNQYLPIVSGKSIAKYDISLLPEEDPQHGESASN